ncbi:MAG TPA: cytochrome P450 [Polyangiaceae bacterium]|jgi:cytochrome P450|nr:cytochrome P450 [Polyangiaceae bacterium]
MQNAIPTVHGRRFVGSLPDMRKDRIALMKRIPGAYGDIAALELGLFGAVVVSGSELCHEVLVAKADAFKKGMGLSVFGRPVLGDGLLTSEQDVHRRNRRLVSPAFVHSRIAGYARTIAECVEEHAERLAGERFVDLSAETMRLTLDVIGRTMFGTDLGPDTRAIGDALTRTLDHINTELLSYVPMPPKVPTLANLRQQKNVRELDDIVYRLIRERRAANRDTGDFLSMLLAARDAEDGGALDDEQVRDEVMTILIAGHETTANGLAWAFGLLDRNPDVLRRLEAESDAVLAGRRATIEDLPRLPCAARVFKEALRMYPPVYMVARRATRDVVLGTYPIARGTLILVNIVGMHHRADYFPSPDDFVPDRFAPEAERALPRHAFLPFSAGPRVCIGNHFALMEGQIALAELAGRLRFELVDGRLPVAEPTLTLRPRGGVPVRVIRRDAFHERRSSEKMPS